MRKKQSMKNGAVFFLLLLSCGSRSSLEYRCDHAKVEKFVNECTTGLQACAGKSEGVARDCLSAAHSMFCEMFVDGQGSRGRVWLRDDDLWRLK